MPWVIAAAALAALLAMALITLVRQPPRVAAAAPEVSPSAAPPDISNMSPRERFNRLYNRVMQAAQSGDESTVSRFTPMALLAYTQLDTIDADARYHVALLKAHTGDIESSLALADTILSSSPGHLFAYMIQGAVARFRKDPKALEGAYTGFLKHYEAEMKAERPEYKEHRTAIDDFRRAASTSDRAPGSS
jgi:hypothetical protein